MSYEDCEITEEMIAAGVCFMSETPLHSLSTTVS